MCIFRSRHLICLQEDEGFRGEGRDWTSLGGAGVARVGEEGGGSEIRGPFVKFALLAHGFGVDLS